MIQTHITLPSIDFDTACADEIDIYLRFMGHYRNTPASRMETKILTSIQFASSIMGQSGAYVAKALVEMGLRAPREAFPVGFLDYFDRAVERSSLAFGGPSPALLELLDEWNGLSVPMYDIPAARPDHVAHAA